MSGRPSQRGPGRPKLPEGEVRNVNLAIKASVAEARLLRRVGALFVGGFSGWARLLLLRAAQDEAHRTAITPLPKEPAPPRRRSARDR